MNYIEYKISEMINDNSDDIVRFLQRHFYSQSSTERTTDSCFHAIDNTLVDIRKSVGDKVYIFGVDELRSIKDLDKLQSSLHDAYSEVQSVNNDLTNETAFSKLIKASRCIYDIENIVKRCIWSDWTKHLIKVDRYHAPDVIQDPKFIIRAIEPHYDSLKTYNAFATSLYTAGRPWFHGRGVAIAYDCNETSLVCMDYGDVTFIYDTFNCDEFKDLLYNLGDKLAVRFVTGENGRFSMYDQFSKNANSFGGTIVLKTSAKPQAIFFREGESFEVYAKALATVMGLPLYKVVNDGLHRQ